MGIEMSGESVYCCKCGCKYSRRKGYFPVSYAVLYKGIGYIPVCKTCIDSMYDTYLAQCNDQRMAVRQMCRKLDLYWSDAVYEVVTRKSSTRSVMTQYIAKISSLTHSGKSYDTTLSNEGTLWSFNEETPPAAEPPAEPVQPPTTPQPEILNTPEDIVAFWGSGYSDDMYRELEQRRQYWMSRLPADTELDVGTEALIRQICSLELDINRDRIAGKAIDKSVNALNNLLGSANLKPTQRKNDGADAELNSTPLGVWAWRWENNYPIPEPDDEAKENSIKKYIFTWMGHISKLLGIKGMYTKLYKEEVERLRVEKPEYEDLDEEDLLIASYSEETGDDTGDENSDGGGSG